MKKTILTLLVIIPICLIAQNKYYWNGNKKEYLNDDFTSSVIYEKENTQLVISKSSSVNRIIEHKDKRNGKYKIVEYKESQIHKSKQFDKSKIRSQSYAFKNERNEKLWLSHFVVFRLKPEYSINDLDKIFIKNQASVVEKKYGIIKIEITDIDNVLNTANEIYETSKVIWCQPDFLITVEKCLAPWQKQFYLKNYYHGHCGFDHDINALEAWRITRGCADITVAVIDDGVEDHPALNDEFGNSRVLNGFTPSGETDNGRPGDGDEHGQACAGIIAASHNNDIHGIAPDIRILPVKIRFGTGIPATEYADAINWAWENGADVLSNSWGGGSDQIIIDAINNAQQFGRGGNIDTGTPGLGAIVVFASGNDGANSVSIYAQHSIAVGAINIHDKPAELLKSILPDKRYTNIGPNQDIVAYGSDVDCEFWSGECPGSIRTIDRIGDAGYSSGDYTDGFSGTSAACPQVSGAAALILSINPNLRRQDVENILFSTAKDLGTTGHDNTYGNGKINVFAAVQEAVKTLGENIYFNEGYLSYNKIKDNTRIGFSGKPECGIAAATYFCDVYKAEASIPYTSDWFWYLGDGLSGAYPNDGNLYTIIEDDNTTTITTFFYYVRKDNSGRTINKWVPFNPAYSWTRKYIISPTENVEFNQVVHSGENVTLYATNSIKLLPGFKAEAGSTFKADISASSSDIICLPNPAITVTLKSAKIEQDIATQNIKIDEIEYEDNELQNIIQIFPNPNKGNFTINISNEIQSNANIEIFNITGQILYRGNIIQRNQNVIFTSEKGIYIVKVKNGNSIFTEKIILK